MTLDDAASSFIEHAKRSGTASGAVESYRHTLELFRHYFPRDITLDDITTESLRDFLARWYVEKRVTDALRDRAGQAENSSSNEHHQARHGEDFSCEAVAYQALLTALTHFFNWASEQSKTQLVTQCIPVLAEFEESVPRAIAITFGLSKSIAARGGAFDFPEFLTSFEDGGHSQYDIGAPGEAGALDSYFRITRVEGTSAEAEDVNTGERIFPIIFPEEVAELISEGYIINLELIRTRDYWHIASCGFAYPPGTDM